MKLLRIPEVGAGEFGVTDSERREVPTWREPGQPQLPLEMLGGECAQVGGKDLGESFPLVLL